ncbi:molybdopterin molybdotransferase MoeA [Aquabacterium sp. OR-4]|uniref:molybdopterin molybdotransferase MoeA n=1 Tax=Aquabacterium sp. OR-4 TaxID=2978127 RepID=UPI0028C66777|nr:gephyrin-like molybdotransferase Glp [Aquabacterium sp. OR-4]MDT7835525.1 molybdopterin molybdotransferase MoeA [Aquabacterium sp. OR-4]
MAEPAAPAPANLPRPTLLTLDEALQRLLAVAQDRVITQTEKLATFDALGRVLARPVVSALDVPPADNTSMDGYVMRAADVPAAGTVLPVSQRIPAGHVGQPLQPGTAARIFTGGQIPAGGDAVVMQEQCEAIADDTGAKGSELGSVRVGVVPAAGQWVRRRGEDVLLGAEVLHAGQRLTPQALGLAASVGASNLHVRRRPRVALFSTGDELVMPGEPLKPGAIYNSNRFTLRGLLQAAGCEVDDLGIVPDNLAATREALRRAAQGNDLILTSGGVSVGEEDHIKPAVKAEGWLEAWQVAMKPGKPLVFGGVRRSDDAGSEALFMGLPGNPVSSFVTCLLAVAPVLRALQGCPAALPPAVQVRADFDWPRPDKRREFLRARLNPQGGVELFANQSSGVLTSAVWADGLVDLPANQVVQRGDTVRLLLLATLIGA